MTYLLLESQVHAYEIIIWGLGILLALALVAAIFWQRRIGRSLETELQQLETEKKKDIEYDFVLRAMGLSVWHINTDTGIVFFDKDYRERRLEFTLGKDGGSYETAATIAEMQARIDSYAFFRTHRRFIVNMKYIMEVDKNIIRLTNDERIEISRRNLAAFNKCYVNYLKYSTT